MKGRELGIKESRFRNLLGERVVRYTDGIIDAENFNGKFIFLATPSRPEIIRFIKSVLFTRGSRRVIYWSGLFTNTTANGRGARGRKRGRKRVLVTKIMR